MTTKPQLARGTSLGGTLLAIAVLSLLAFSLSSLMVSHLRMSSRQDRGQLASNAARSTMSAAVAKVLEDPKFGQTGTLEQEVRLKFPEATGLLTFHRDNAKKDGLPHSTNNLDGREDAPGADGVMVPASTVYLTAIGRSGGVERRIDAVLRVPPFPWAIASGGRIDTRNGVYVASLPEGVWPPPTDESELLPADLVANGIGSKAISLGDESTVLGNVEAVGEVHISSPNKVVVKGEVLSGSSPVEIPVVRPTDYDPVSKHIEHFELTAGNVEELTGTARAGVPLEFVRPLKLDNAQLYVDGDLTLRGGVTGSGALIATGDVTVLGGARIEAPTELAVISGGQVRLTGEGAERSRIRGLFYADKGLEASEMTLVGSLLTGNASTGIALDRVNVFHEELPDREPVSAQTLYFGRREPGASTATLTGSPSVTRPDYEYGFSIKIEPVNPNSRFPLKLTLDPGFAIGTSGSWTVADEQAFDILSKAQKEKSPFWRFFTGQFDSGVSDYAKKRFGMTVKISTVAFFENDLCDAIGQTWKQESVTAISLMQDISRFLPIEDRIRLISWIER